MTRRRLLAELDSAELTDWQLFLQARHDREEEARHAAEFERRIGAGD